MKLLLMSLLLSHFSIFSQVEVPTIDKLATSGMPVMIKNSSKCTDHNYPINLYSKNNFNILKCIQNIRLPKKVFTEINIMESNQLENISDYDQRVTKLLVFRQKDLSPKSGYTVDNIKNLAEKFNIDRVILEDSYKGTPLSIRSYIGEKNSFSYFRGSLMLNENTVERPYFVNHLGSILKGQLILEIKFGEFLHLYPGGGFGVIHNFFITDKYLIYLKQAGWDA
jgi:hypothetical protein